MQDNYYKNLFEIGTWTPKKKRLKIRKKLKESIKNVSFSVNDRVIFLWQTKKKYKDNNDSTIFNKRGFNYLWIHTNWTLYDQEWIDMYWFDKEGFNIKWRDKSWFDRNWINEKWIDKKGYDKEGYNKK